MSTSSHPEAQAPPAAPAVALATARRMIVLTLGAAVFSALFVLSYGYALHAPRPHHVRLDVAGTASAPVQAALDRTWPGGFRVREVADAGVARRDVEDTRTYGALVVPATGPVTIMTAGAQGLSAQQAVTAAFSAVAHAQGRPAVTADLAPLPTGDRAGQSSFAYEIGLLIPGVIGSVGFYLLGRRARLWVRVGAAAGYSVLASALGVLVLDGMLGALTGSPGVLLATGILAAAAFVLTVAALHTLFGLAGTGIAAAVLLVVGNAANGSSVPVPFLPDGYRQLAQWLPNAAAVRAFRDDVYFHDHGLARPLLTLAAWVAAALVLIACADLVHLRRRRRTPLLHEAIHATPLLPRRSPASPLPASPSPASRSAHQVKVGVDHVKPRGGMHRGGGRARSGQRRLNRV